MSENVIVLCPSEVISIEPQSLQPQNETGLPDLFSPFAEDAVEEMVVFLAGIEAAWASGEFKRLSTTLINLEAQAARAGLSDVAYVAGEAAGLVGSNDDVALAAVVSRLVRVGEASLATLLEIAYRQI